MDDDGNPIVPTSEEIERARVIADRLDEQKLVIRDLAGATEVYTVDNIAPKKALEFRNVTDSNITFAESLSVLKIVIDHTRNSTFNIYGTIATATLELWECENVTIVTRSDIKTLQVDICRNTTIEFQHKGLMGSIVQAGAYNLSVRFTDEPSSNAEIGLEKIREQHPDTNDTNHQFITRWIDGNLLSERIIRLKNEYPTTEREYRQTNPEDEFNQEAVDAERADLKKQKGNQAFQSGEIGQAVIYYTEALELQPSNHVCYSNRAACFIRLGEYENALADASRCVTLEPTNVKGWFRKGLSLQALNRHVESLEAFEKGLALEPNNKELASAVKMAEFKVTMQMRQRG